MTREKLIKSILDAYHTTRFVDISLVDFILAKTEDEFTTYEKEVAEPFASVIYRLYEGDEVEGLELLRGYNFIDEDQEWIYDDED